VVTSPGVFHTQFSYAVIWRTRATKPNSPRGSWSARFRLLAILLLLWQSQAITLFFLHSFCTISSNLSSFCAIVLKMSLSRFVRAYSCIIGSYLVFSFFSFVFLLILYLFLSCIHLFVCSCHALFTFCLLSSYLLIVSSYRINSGNCQQNYSNQKMLFCCLSGYDVLYFFPFRVLKVLSLAARVQIIIPHQ